MKRARRTRTREAQLAFEALSIEGGLLSPDWLSRAAQLAAGGQSEADYRIPKGLNLRDEIGRFWRIAQAHWSDFVAGRAGKADPRLLAERFVEALLRESFGFATLAKAEPVVLAERSYPVGFAALGGRVPVVIAPAGSGLDTLSLAFGDGTRRRSAFGLAQEYLNAADGAMWGLASDGLTLRIVRDNASLTRPAWIEADLQRLFTEERYADFAALWLLAHETRFGRPALPGETPQPVAECALETWRSAGREEGTRAREHLRRGVEDALIALGQGFLAHPDNQPLRAALQSGALSTKDYENQLLRLVYRLIFLLTVEERGVLHPDGSEEKARSLYAAGYSLRRLRERSVKRSAHDRFADLWEATKIVFRGVEGGEPRLGLPALAGIFAKTQCPALDAAKLENRALLLAVFKLSWLREDSGLARVNWRDMGPEELGSVYESLLELVPQITKDGRQFAFATGGETKGNARKTTGSYYTPDSLVQVLLDSALEPVIQQVVNGQWRVAGGTFESEQEREHAHEVVSRSRGVEARDGDRRSCVPDDPQLPEGGDVRNDVADPSGGGIDSGERRGGLGPAGRQGVRPVPSHRERELARAGDASPAERQSRFGDTGSHPDRAGRADDSVEAAVGAATQDSDLIGVRIWDLTPLATRHSRLAIEALLGLSIVDPACGSGHFLLAAARRLASHVARLSANGTPSAAEYRHALRQVVGRCIYGVDLNPMAVELCKVSLWMEAVEPGLPLTFLDSHIQHGNALLGTTPELMAKGIPDAAWEPIEGDDKKTASALKKRNKKAAEGQRSLDTLWSRPSDAEAQAVARAVAELEAASDANPEALAKKESQWDGILGSAEYRHQKLVADAWCAAFVWPKQPGELAEVAPTNELWRQLRDGQGQPPALTTKTVGELAEQYRFFHWNLQFPHVFAKGGFDVVLGNPPWERVKLQEQEFFASRSDEIAGAANAATRKKLIARLPTIDPTLWDEWCSASREAEGQSHSIRHSGRYPLCGRGDVNTYAIFAEHTRSSLGPLGRAGFIVPPGLATDETTKAYFQELVAMNALEALYEFENEEFLFPGIDHRVRFIVITVAKERPASSAAADLSFANRSVTALADRDRHFSLSPEDFALLNPNTRTCPTFRSRRDADINLALYRRAGVLWREDDPDGNPWGLRFMAMLHMANDSALFRTRAELEATSWLRDGNQYVLEKRRMLPLIEAKMVHHFDHRFGTYEGQTDAQSNQGKLPEFDDAAHADPRKLTFPKYWVAESEVDSRLEGRSQRGWLLGWRDICRSTDQRTVIASLIPRVAVGHKLPLMFSDREPRLVAALYANLCSLVLDYAARQKVGGTSLTYFLLKQFPVLGPQEYAAPTRWNIDCTLREWILPRVLELTYTAWDLEPFAHDVGYDRPPFRWDRERRFVLRCELDAAFFHLYGLSRDDTDYVMDTFPIVRKNDEKAHGEYRTKRVILEIYDAMAAAARTGTPYQTRLGPPPADPRVAHPDTRPAAQKRTPS